MIRVRAVFPTLGSILTQILVSVKCEDVIQWNSKNCKQRKHKEDLKRVYEKKIVNSCNLPRNFQFAECRPSDNPSTFIEKYEIAQWKNGKRKIDEESLQLHCLVKKAKEKFINQSNNIEELECEKSLNIKK